MPQPSRRPERYVPRHSTREVPQDRHVDAVVDVTGDGSSTEVLASVLAALDGLDARERETV